MTLQYKISLFVVKLFKNQGINVDRAELLTLSIVWLSLIQLLDRTETSSRIHSY